MACKFCKVEESETLIDFSSNGDLRIRAYGFISSGLENNDWALNVSLDANDFELVVKEIKIHYCPMCGRKLADSEIGKE